MPTKTSTCAYRRVAVRGCAPIRHASNLFFQLLSGRYERASLIVTSNKPIGVHLIFRVSRSGAVGDRSVDLAAAHPPRPSPAVGPSGGQRRVSFDG
jgi:hypothetical protein